MKMNDLFGHELFLPLTILASCILILSILLIILYCMTIKYIKKASVSPIMKTDFSKPLPPILEKDSTEVDSSVPEPNTMDTVSSLPEPDTMDTNSSISEPDTLNISPFVSSTPFSLFSLNNLQSEEVDIIQAAKDAIDSLTPFAEAQKIKLHLSTTCEELMIMAVPESIRILFRNIIDNSIKYMGRAGHMIITISLLGDDIFLILKDTGKGLNEEETTHIFELNF